ncbi:MAG: Xanthine/uracil/thiamine/ascorbate permease family protein [uncultured Acetobacteraceae bacterium]|uniref:Xanthine/uracil/thiamine/ascorbate permease family protein n=1 Tax=uncultured Acetobacteraceae bacterium TaxID=169975 RepID=A0A6J4I7D1_9PROT|nr:MAG: Xanthine/uracil/thiamine/ascorbate permease family protein [uncultured Acetobacteraceae bacterium]
MERFFGLRARGSTARTEALAGATTFLTMAYILAVNPQILAQAGIDPGAAFVATCLSAAIGSALMGLLANLPIALAPGMGLNAYFTFAVVLGAGVSWQAALGAVFLSGLLFLAVSLLRVREWLVNGIPLSLKLGIAAGIGFFLGLIGLRAMGLVAAHPATLVGLGPIGEPATLLACAGFVLIAGLSARGVPGAIVIGILATAALGIPLGLTRFQGLVSLPPSLAPTLFQLDVGGALQLGVLGIVFTFFLVDLLDNTGTLIATTHRAGLMRPDGSVPNLGRALTADSGGAVIGAVLGTSTTVSYIESAAGIGAGGRTGLTALTVAALFLLALFLAPLAASIPGFATAPALVFVACLMAQALRSLPWDDATDYVPAVLTALAMPFTFSIATGIGLGFIAHAALKTVAGRAAEVSGAVWLVAALCVAKFALG